MFIYLLLGDGGFGKLSNSGALAKTAYIRDTTLLNCILLRLNNISYHNIV